jgi:hypothetical protein
MNKVLRLLRDCIINGFYCSPFNAIVAVTPQFITLRHLPLDTTKVRTFANHFTKDTSQFFPKDGWVFNSFKDISP